MDYIKAERQGVHLEVSGLRHFCLDDILDCGQCFRWGKLEPGYWRGTVRGRTRTLRQESGLLTFYDTGMDEFEEIWYDYFDFGRDYGEVKRRLAADGAMARAVEFTPGMRVLRQEPWEALCSFILSQNNNIKRIKGIVARLCETFGDDVGGGFAFPPPESLARLEPEDLSPLRCGFRAGYVLDAARRVSSGEIDFEELAVLPLSEAAAVLQTIRGVGPKVAACALLYGLGRTDSVPVDVWIGRAMTAFYPNGMPEDIADIAGLGQQYLFHYCRQLEAAPTGHGK